MPKPICFMVMPFRTKPTGAVAPAPAANAPATPARPSTAPYDPGPAPALEPLVKPAGDTRQP